MPAVGDILYMFVALVVYPAVWLWFILAKVYQVRNCPTRDLTKTAEPEWERISENELRRADWPPEFEEGESELDDLDDF